MSENRQLPDEILDAVAGGTFTYQGKEVAELENNPDGTTITMRDGSTATCQWNDETKARLSASLKSMLDTSNEIDGKHFSETQTFALEDYLK